MQENGIWIDASSGGGMRCDDSGQRGIKARARRPRAPCGPHLSKRATGGPQYYDDKAQLLDVLATRRPFRWYGPGAEPPDKVAMFEPEFARRVTPLLHNCGACGERFDSFAGINAGRHDAGFPSPTA